MDASQTYLQGRADDAPAIQRRLAGYKVRYAQASGKQKERIGYQIAILEQRLTSLNTNPNEQAVADLPEQPGDANKNPKWLPYLTIGLGGAGLLAALYGLSK